MRRIFPLLLAAGCAGAAGVPRSQCFPFEALPQELRARAEETLPEALDREALYTLIGGLKPMSSAILTEERRLTLDTAKPDIRTYEEFQQIAGAWRCGDELWAGIAPLRVVVPPTQTAETDELGRPHGHRTVYGNVLNMAVVRHVIETHPAIFHYHGITVHTHPAELLTRIGNSDNVDQNLAFGYLYGYPSHAVEFYSRVLDHVRKGQPLKPGEAKRVEIPTYTPQELGGGVLGSQFRYRVAPDHVESGEERHLRETAAKILAAYRVRRAKYIGKDKPGVLALIRDWYDDGEGLCAPSNAKVQ